MHNAWGTPNYTMRRDVSTPPQYASVRAEEIASTFDRIDQFTFLTAGGRRKLIDAAVLYPLSLPAVASVLSGAITRAELAESVAALDAAPLTGEEVARIRAIHGQEVPNRP